MHINKNTLFSGYIRKYSPFFFLTQDLQFSFRVPFIFLRNMCPKEQQDNIFSRQYLFCRVYPSYWTPPSCWRPWRPRVWGSDVAIQTPKHRRSSFWFQRSHYLHFFGGGHWDDPQEIRTNRMCSIVLKSAASAYIFHLKLLSIWLIHWRTPPQWTVRVWFNLQENWH